MNNEQCKWKRGWLIRLIQNAPNLSLRQNHIFGPPQLSFGLGTCELPYNSVLLGEILACWASCPPSVHQARTNEIINKRIALRYALYRWKTQSGVSHSHILRSKPGPRLGGRVRARRKPAMRFTLATICLLVLATAAFAQSDRGTITGAVKDPAGAVVARAEVIARNTATGTEYKTVTTETGNYTIASLPTGSYELRVEASGFKKFISSGVQVQLLQTTRMDATLEVGASSDTVTVTATSPLLQTESAEQTTNISGQLFNAMPLNFGATNSIRGWLSFIQLAPGVSVPNQTSPQTANINGAPGGSFKIYLEGQDVTSTNDTVWTSTVASASVETIGEFAIQTSNFSAEFGQVLGGVFNFTTKSGTNEFHGSGYEYLTNEAFNARRPLSTPFASSPRAPKALDRKDDYGFSVGGPVRLPKLYDGRNKTFFFFSLERYRNVTRSSGGLATLPTDAYRQGEFSAALGRQLGIDLLGRPIIENAIYDPLTQRDVTAGLLDEKTGRIASGT